MRLGEEDDRGNPVGGESVRTQIDDGELSAVRRRAEGVFNQAGVIETAGVAHPQLGDHMLAEKLAHSFGPTSLHPKVSISMAADVRSSG